MDPEDAAGLRLFFVMVGQFIGAPVRDIVLTSGFALSTVLTMASSFVEDLADAYAFESDVRILGKLTRLVRPGEDAITSPGGVRLTPAGDIEALIKSAREGLGELINVQIRDAFVDRPVIQVLPLALFV